MKALTKIKTAGLASAAALLLVPTISMAEVSQNVAVNGSGHSVVHRVSYSLAESKAYTRAGASGYKWGKSADQGEDSQNWAVGASNASGYKWEKSNHVAVPRNQELTADRSNFEWGVRSFSEQSAYKWGMRSFSDQSAYKWGMRSFSDQSAYKWGMRNFSDQSAYKWGMRNFSDQSAYKWGMR